MRNRWLRLLIVIAILGPAVLLLAWRWTGSPGDLPLLGRPPAGPPPAPIDCRRDPAGLLDPPPRPDGRPANYLHTCGSHLYDQHGREVRIAGVNWSGMETLDFAPGGLSARNWQEILDQVAALGYNTIRLPFSNQALEPGRRVVNVNFTLNPDLEGLTGLEVMDRVIAGAHERGLKVILDRHRPTADFFGDLWYSDEVPEERWLRDWQLLAARYLGDDTVIGVDLHNEPRGRATWGSGDPNTDWRLAAERAGNAVLAANPYLLIFVEGIERYAGDAYWWGGNLQGVRAHPVRLRVPNRVVYSPHDYGPAVAEQSWFWDRRFPANLPAEWDRHWGYIHREGIAPVVVGEFGGHSVGDDRDGQWQRALVTYLQGQGIGALVWSLNPGWDTGGIFAGDWRTLNVAKQDAYRALLAPPLDGGAVGAFGRAPARPVVLYRQGEPAGGGDGFAFALRVLNQSAEPLDPSGLEVRYWFKADGLTQERAEAAAATVEASGPPVAATVVRAQAPGEHHYLSLRFPAAAKPVPPYLATDEVRVRLRGLAGTGHAEAADYSYAAPPQEPRSFRQWERVTVYRDRALAWGKEP